MDVLVTGGDTELGRTIAAGFIDAGHAVVIAGAHRDDLELVAKELDVESIVFDNTDTDSVKQARAQLPHHLDAVVNVPVLPNLGDPRSYSLSELAGAWQATFEAVLLSAVLTVQIAGDHLRSGGSIINVHPDAPRDGSAGAAIKAALADWTAGQAGAFGTRGITVNAVAAGNSAEAGYEGLSRTSPSVGEEIARMAVFIATPAARHITGQTLHVSRGVPAGLG